MTVHDFQKLDFDQTQNTLLVRVSEQSEFATHELIKEAQYVIMGGLEVCKAPCLLVNLLNLRFVISPDMQEWLAEVIIPRIFALGVTKIAYIMPTAFVESLSIEQVHDEVAQKASREETEIGVCYFDNEAEALQWFRKSKNRLNQYA